MALHNRVYSRVQTQLNLGCHFLVHGFYCGYRISMDFPQHISEEYKHIILYLYLRYPMKIRGAIKKVQQSFSLWIK